MMPPGTRWSRLAFQGEHRLLFVTLVVVGSWVAARAAGLTGRFTFESIRNLIAGTGVWGVATFTIAFCAAQLLRVPSLVFVAAAVAVYGRSTGIFVALLGALASAIVSFSVIRALAGQPLVDVRPPFIRRLLKNIDSHPVLTVALLRLIFQTAPPLNYALPMTAVRWRDHLVGSALGLPVPVTVMALFFEWFLRRGG